jgi:hypothetical protein
MHDPFAQEIEGAGKAGCFAHPQPRVGNEKTTRAKVTTGSPNNPAFPARWLYGLFRALPGDRALYRRLHVKTCKLDVSVGAPGPHDFAVRVGALCRARYLRPSTASTASRTNVRDDRDTPLREGTRRRRENR